MKEASAPAPNRVPVTARDAPRVHPRVTGDSERLLKLKAVLDAKAVDRASTAASAAAAHQAAEKLDGQDNPITMPGVT